MDIRIKKLQEKIKYLETRLEKHLICPIYGVYTRTALEELWEKGKQIEELAIAFIDIDDLKLHNSKLGQFETNRILSIVFSNVRKEEIIGRFYYGDELIILSDKNHIIKPCQRVMEGLAVYNMSATITIGNYKGEKDLSEAVKEVNDLNQYYKTIKKATIYNFT